MTDHRFPNSLKPKSGSFGALESRKNKFLISGNKLSDFNSSANLFNQRRAASGLVKYALLAERFLGHSTVK